MTLRMRRKLKGAMRSKTVWFSFAVMFFSGLEMYFPRLEAIIKPEYYLPAFFAIGMISLILRFFTEKSLEDR